MMTPSTPFTPFQPLTQFRPFVVTDETRVETRGETRVESRLESPMVRLARSAGAGDHGAMRALLRELAPRIERVVRAVLGRANEDADDVIQQAMMGFVQALPAFRGDCEPVHFASRVAARTAIACARRRRTLRARHEDGVELDAIPQNTNVIPEPLATTERTRRMELLRDVLAQIPAEQAETLTLRCVLGWSLAEIAETMDVPLNTVRSRLRLAKTALRNVIQADPAAQEELGDE